MSRQHLLLVLGLVSRTCVCLFVVTLYILCRRFHTVIELLTCVGLVSLFVSGFLVFYVLDDLRYLKYYMAASILSYLCATPTPLINPVLLLLFTPCITLDVLYFKTVRSEASTRSEVFENTH